MSGNEMSDDREEQQAGGGPGGEPATADDVEILGFEAVDEAEADSGVFDLLGDDRAGEESPEASAAGPEEREEELMARLAKAEERHLRLLADFDNFRKRAERERQESSRHMVADVVRELLPVVDNLERALAAPGAATELREGVEMIVRQFVEALRRFDVEAVPAVGEPFDPAVHEAVQRSETDEVAEPTVVEEFQRGYLLRGRLIRPALVRVAVPPESGSEGAE